MEKFINLKQIDEATDFVKSKISKKPEIGMILGSGLGGLADMVAQPEVISTKNIPNWPVSTVLGHQGKLVFGMLEGKSVMVLQGRTHYYEGYSMDQVTLPIRVMQRMGISTLIVTNAAGAINPTFEPGDLMVITDHITLVAMSGLNPLRGPNIDEFGERFPDMSQVYDRQMIDIARKVAVEKKMNLREGVYICLSGPSFETPADLRFLHAIGADAVGMSTVPEAIVARHGQMRVFGISGISNKANLDGGTISTHEEVLRAGEVLVPKLMDIVTGLLRQL
jgi:purine-nucleoside phosphorylase